MCAVYAKLWSTLPLPLPLLEAFQFISFSNFNFDAIKEFMCFYFSLNFTYG
jgi:hypothetical protein